MRRILCCVCMSICLMLFTGCGKKSLKCVSELDNDILSMKQEYKIKFNKDSVSSLSINIDVDGKNSDIELSDTILKTVSDKFSTYYDEDGVSHSVSEKSNGFNFKLAINFNKVSSSTKSKIDIINYASNYDTIKSDLEQEGFTCK